MKFIERLKKLYHRLILVFFTKAPEESETVVINDYDGIEAEEGNVIDKIIVDKGNTPTAHEIYRARWVWYHSILAFEIFLTNILLIALIIVTALK